MAQLLTKKKQKWVGQFKPTAAIKGVSFQSNAAAARKYQRRM